jgi:hypothetical protein
MWGQKKKYFLALFYNQTFKILDIIFSEQNYWGDNKATSTLSHQSWLRLINKPAEMIQQTNLLRTAGIARKCPVALIPNELSMASSERRIPFRISSSREVEVLLRW